jgi:hypothetical protein
MYDSSYQVLLCKYKYIHHKRITHHLTNAKHSDPTTTPVSTNSHPEHLRNLQLLYADLK